MLESRSSEPHRGKWAICRHPLCVRSQMHCLTSLRRGQFDFLLMPELIVDMNDIHI